MIGRKLKNDWRRMVKNVNEKWEKEKAKNAEFNQKVKGNKENGEK